MLMPSHCVALSKFNTLIMTLTRYVSLSGVHMVGKSSFLWLLFHIASGIGRRLIALQYYIIQTTSHHTSYLPKCCIGAASWFY